MLCKAMEWGALPEAGGLYQQHPKLLDDWLYIFQAQSAHDELENARKGRDSGGPQQGRRARP